MHRFQRFFNVPKHSWKAFLGMLHKCASKFVLIASIDSKRWPFSVDLSFGNRKKSAGTRSGEYAVKGQSSRVWPSSHVNLILFLIIHQQVWHKFGCNAMHAQIFGKNIMAHCFWDTHFFSYLSNCQTTIWMDDFTNFCNIIVSFRRWWPSWTRIIINRSSALFETFPPLVRLSPAHGFFPECYFQHFKCLSNRFSNFHTNSLLVKNTHFLVSRELPDMPNMW